MSSYWRNDEKIKVSQTKVSIPSTNGQSYEMTAGSGGRRVDFEIPPSVKFMDGKNSYLQMDVKISLNGQNPTRLSLDPFIGGQSLVKNIRVYSGTRAVLLEEISDYNCKVQVQYSYNQDESLRKMRALKEGSLVPTIKNRGTEGTSESNLVDLSTNPYFKPKLTAGTADFGDDDFLTAKLSLPIHSGIFSDSDKIFPVMMTQGLYVEVDMEDPARCIKQLDSVNRHRRMKQNAFFHGVNSAGGAFATGAADRTEIFLGKQNNVVSVENCPFVRGEAVGICQVGNPNGQANLTQSDGTAYYPVISNISVEGGYVKLTFADNVRNSSATGNGVDITSNNFIVYSAAMDTKRVQFDDKSTQILAPTTAYPCKLTCSNLELVLQQVELDARYEAGMMSKMKDGGSIELDILTTTNIKSSLLSSNRNATLNLEAGLTRVKSAIVVPTDASVYNSAQLIGGLGATYNEESLSTDTLLHSCRSGQVGIIDKLSSYQFVVDDKLVPSRPVEVGKINGGKSISAQPLMQTEQALNQASIIPRSFCDYNRNFVIGRAFALNDGVANINNKTLQLQLLYNESTAAGVDEPPQHNKLFMAFMYHIRRISIKGDSVVVQM